MKTWIRVTFRDSEVLARCHSDGALVVERGLVPFCYKPGGKVYSTRMDRITPVDGATPEHYGDPSAGAVKPKREGKGAGASGAVAAGYGRSSDEVVNLWTDGACTGNPGPAGAGVLYLFQGEERELSEFLGEGTNNIAELMAIHLALEMVVDRSISVDVMTDSSYCIGLLSKGWKAKANQELVAAIRARLAEFRDVRFVKVKGHAGIPENERADELAREAIVRSR